MFRTHTKNCKSCKYFYRDGNYTPHCRIYLSPMKILDSNDKCPKWEEKTFSKIFGFTAPDKSSIEI